MRRVVSGIGIGALIGLCVLLGQGCPVANQPAISVRVLNVSSAAMLELHVVPATANNWGPNLLPAPLYRDQSFDLYGLVPGQYYHFAAVMSNGQVIYQYDQYLTPNQILSWTIYNNKSEVAEFVPLAAEGAMALPLMMAIFSWMYGTEPLCMVCA